MMHDVISSREVSEMLFRLDHESNVSNLLDTEADRAQDLASYFWDSKHDLREHYVSRYAVLGDIDCETDTPLLLFFLS